MSNIIIRFSLICYFVAFTNANISPTENYTTSAFLDADDKVKLYWKSNDTDIVFELHGKTTGWIGMGISPNGGMAGADIVVGWVKEGNIYISDRHADSNGLPPLDPIQNVELLAGEEKDGWTMIKYRRQLASCEPGFDLPITKDTLKIIYAFGEADPAGEDLTTGDYHGSTSRGVKSLILLESPVDGSTSYPEGEEHASFELRNDKFEVPAEKTYYNCRLYKLPTFTEKQHIVKVEPIITQGNEMNVHHMLVFQCLWSVNEEESIGKNVRCYGSDMPPDFRSCAVVFHSWAIGGGTFYYPTHTGLPLGDADSPSYVTIETHYDNPEGKSGIIDSSGFRFTYTSQLRQYDAAVLVTGHIVNGLQHLIPPNAESFLDYGDCSSNCLDSFLNAGNEEEFKVFGTVLHSHLLGKRMTVRHIRGKTELPFLSQDNAYDFNYQEMRSLSEERVVKKGDSLQVVCDYHTKGVRDGFTTGGLDTSREMCLGFLFYYPKVPISFCQTEPGSDVLLSYFGIEEFDGMGEPTSMYEDIYDLQITKPENLSGQTIAEYLNSMEWNDETTKELSIVFRDMQRQQQCFGPRGTPDGVELSIPAITVESEYVAGPLNCSLTPEATTPVAPLTTKAEENDSITSEPPIVIGPNTNQPPIQDETSKSGVVITDPGVAMETTTGGASNLHFSIFLNLLSVLLILGF